MDKRYQVFVSSTYEDLQEERQEVMHALLELECIPSGMEIFPAASEDQWTVITRVIDDCDYYVVIVGGRYGTVDKTGMSYTEREYRYALQKRKPVIGFLHRAPGDLPAKKREESEEKKKKLEALRELVSQKLCQFWENPTDLGSKVSRSLIRLIKQHPGVGWVRADQVPSEDISKEVLGLRKRIDDLEGELAAATTQAPKGTEELAQGDDDLPVQFTFHAKDSDLDFEGHDHRAKHTLSWNEVFYCVSPCMIDEATQERLSHEISDLVESRTRAGLQNQLKGKKLSQFRIESESFHTILIQLRSLGLIVKAERPKGSKTTTTSWKLTPYGDSVMTRLRAIRRRP